MHVCIILFFVVFSHLVLLYKPQTQTPAPSRLWLQLSHETQWNSFHLLCSLLQAPIFPVIQPRV